ncbi:MAG TPA: IS1595 family transposase [Terracidiphilus sp.]|nr:IS1595 family transposase [Terracidiphilus sp.]
MSCFTDAKRERIETAFRVGFPPVFGPFWGRAVTIIDLCSTFSSDDRCRELLERLRWPMKPECPRCFGPVVRLATNARVLYCKDCDYQFTVTANTIFHDSHLPLIKWFAATYLLCESRKGMSANQIKRTLGISYKTAWYLCHRIRAAMATTEKGMMDGIIEMDETYVGGKIRKGTPDAQKNRLKNKEIVIGIKQRGGELRFFHAEDVKSGTLAKYIKDNVSKEVEVIMTDEYISYPGAVKQSEIEGLEHKTVNHFAGVYADGDITTNGIESAFSLLKRGIVGTWHKVSAKHLPKYLEEMTFRFNRRSSKTLFLDTLRHMITADPLTFEKLTA